MYKIEIRRGTGFGQCKQCKKWFRDTLQCQKVQEQLCMRSARCPKYFKEKRENRWLIADAALKYVVVPLTHRKDRGCAIHPGSLFMYVWLKEATIRNPSQAQYKR